MAIVVNELNLQLNIIFCKEILRVIIAALSIMRKREYALKGEPAL